MLAMALSRWLGCGAMSVSSHASDGTTEVTWSLRDVIAESCWRWRCWGGLAVAWCHCRVMLAMGPPWWLGHGAMSVMSHAGDGATKATWPWRDVVVSHVDNGVAESCWRWCCRGDLAVARYQCRVMMATVPSSHAGDGAATQGYTACGKIVQPLSLRHQGVTVEWRSLIGMPIVTDIRVGA
jgi:hypothetical protein